MKKRLLILSTLIIFTLSIMIIIFFSYDKKNVSYALKVPESLAIYIFNEETNKYDKKTSVVPHGYELNTEKSYCESGGEVINYNAYEEYVNYALATGDKCHLYFDRYLPEGYTKLEYIQRTDGQYINTGVLVSGSASTQVEVDFMYTSLNNYGTIIGTQGGNHNYILREENGTNIMRVWGGAQNVELGKVVVGQRNSATIMWGNGKVSASLVLGNRTFNANTTMTTEDAPTPLLLFDSNVDGQLGSAINADIIGRTKMYKCNIWINGELKREFVPALDTDGIAGMYDRVEKKFYANAGTGQFKYAISGDALPPEYTQLEYLESTGTQYIDTGWKTTGINFSVSAGFMITGDSIDQTIFGADEAVLSLNMMVNPSREQIFQYGINSWHNTGAHSLARQYQYIDTVIKSSSGLQRFFANGSEVSTTASNETGLNMTHTIGLFTNHKGSSGANSYYTTGRMYYFKVVESGKLVRNMIPALNRDGIPGMYDTVEGKFYTNAGSGQFKYAVNNNRLPDGYTPVTYIESESAATTLGGSYIDTGFTPTQNTSILTVSKSTNTANDHYILYGSGVDYTTQALEMYTWDNTYQINYGNSPYHYTITPKAGELTIIVQNKNISRITNETATQTYTHTNNTFTSPGTLTLFALHRNADVYTSLSAIKLYATKIWDGEVLVRDMVPCINPYGEVGLYDVVNNKFYGNSGGGRFKAGASSEYTTLNYIEATGTQYIDTGYSAPEGFYTEIDAIYTSVVGSYIVGSHNLGEPYGRNGVGPNGLGSWEIGTGDTCPSGNAVAANTRYFLDVSTVKGGSYLKVNGTSQITTADASLRSSFNLLVFYNQYSKNMGGATSPVKLYSLKIWDEKHELVRVFIPAKNASGTIGLYDALSGNFYTNAGSGTFASG